MPYLGRSLALEAEKEESSSPMSFKSVLKDTHKDQKMFVIETIGKKSKQGYKFKKQLGNWVKD